MINEKFYHLKIGDIYPTVIMGVVNLSPESFYKGSVVSDEKSLIAKIDQMVKSGAKIIDLGAASTAPPNKYKGVKTVSEEEEKDRIEKAMKIIKNSFDDSQFLISIDTQRPSVAELALKYGAHIINDVSGFKANEDMARIVAEYDVPVILMAAREKPGDAKSILDILKALRDSIEIGLSHGVDIRKIIVDPGIGFGKKTEEDLAILNNLQILRVFNRPILIGVSRKAFIGEILGLKDPNERLLGSLGATAIAVYNSAHIIRTHDVLPTTQVVRIAENVRKQNLSSTKSDLVNYLLHAAPDALQFIAEEIFEIDREDLMNTNYAMLLELDDKNSQKVLDVLQGYCNIQVLESYSKKYYHQKVIALVNCSLKKIDEVTSYISRGFNMS